MIDEESKLFNKLTPEQHEAISMLLEEAGEVVQICGKILRHGLYSHHPDKPNEPNYFLLEHEVGDFLGVAQKLMTMGILRVSIVTANSSNKMHRAAPYLHHLTVHSK